MKKYSLLYSILFSLVFSGCYFTFNAPMCDQIASDPNSQIPSECRNYNEEEADKAFNQTKHQTQSEDEEVLEYHKEDKEKDE